MSMNIGTCIKWKYPNAIPGKDWSVVTDPVTGAQTIEFWNVQGASQPTTSDLQSWWIPALQADKINQLKAACQATIFAGFTSSALGTSHTYGFTEQDQRNLNEQMTMLLLDSTITSVSWKTLDAGVLTHTRDQFIQVCKDANAFKWSNVQKYWNLVSQVQAATTESQINAITW